MLRDDFRKLAVLPAARGALDNALSGRPLIVSAFNLLAAIGWPPSCMFARLFSPFYSNPPHFVEIDPGDMLKNMRLR